MSDLGNGLDDDVHQHSQGVLRLGCNDVEGMDEDTRRVSATASSEAPRGTKRCCRRGFKMVKKKRGLVCTIRRPFRVVRMLRGIPTNRSPLKGWSQIDDPIGN